MTISMELRNEARRSSLAGRPCLKQYITRSDVAGLVDKETFQRMYEEKWGGAPWVEESDNTDKIIILDPAPASSPCSSASLTSKSLSSTPSTSKRSSRRTTLEDEYNSLLRDELTYSRSRRRSSVEHTREVPSPVSTENTFLRRSSNSIKRMYDTSHENPTKKKNKKHTVTALIVPAFGTH